MESVHELAEVSASSTVPHLELVQGEEAVVTVRCPECKGLRSIDRRHLTRQSATCKECLAGKVVQRTKFHNYWLQRFTMAEIRQMAQAIWG